MLVQPSRGKCSAKFKYNCCNCGKSEHKKSECKFKDKMGNTNKFRRDAYRSDTNDKRKEAKAQVPVENHQVQVQMRNHPASVLLPVQSCQIQIHTSN